MTELSIVILSWNTKDLLRACLDTVVAADKPGATEIIVIDNDSKDGSADMVAEAFPSVLLERNDVNEGFAKGCNQGIRRARGRYVLLLNSDTELGEGALLEMHTFLEEHPDYGAVAPKLVSPDGTTQRCCQAFPRMRTTFFFSTPFERWMPNSAELKRYFLRDWDHEDERDVDQPPAAVLMVRSSVLEEVGHFDEDLWLFYNDVDLSKRMAAAGWKTRYLADTRVLHHIGASTKQFGDFVLEWQRNRLAYYRKHHGWISGPWIKACVTTVWLDFVGTQLWRKVRGKPADPLGPLTSAYFRFLRF